VNGCVDTPLRVADGWRVSRCPAGRRFAFTIVHDADSSYSERLRPLFDVFDELKLALTVSVFAYWAEWAHDGRIWARWRAAPDAARAFLAPCAVPLADPSERDFYRELAARGHEIALHSPSDTSDRRARVESAFADFDAVFGHTPMVYVEHAARRKLDALGNQGADPTSPYYCLDLLRRHAPWVWVDHAGGLTAANDDDYYRIRPNGSPFDTAALQRYGLDKAFVRTGHWRQANGEGFLTGYSPAHIDRLATDGGIALVYTHLDAQWLDPATRRMRQPIVERLRYLTSKAGWFAPASQILDRARAVAGIELGISGQTLQVRNAGPTRLDEVAIASPARTHLARDGHRLERDELGQGIIGTLAPRSTLALEIVRD
jgi:hypothetical protein